MENEDFGGESLDRLAQSRSFDLAEKLAIAIAATEALGALHERNVLHERVSPANFVCNPKTGALKIIDFGASTVLGSERPATPPVGANVGTLRYISPEQTGRAGCALDFRADLYSLGATLYDLFTGEPPFSSDDPAELVHCHLAEKPEEPCEKTPAIPKALSDVIMRLLAKRPEARYQSAHGLRADLERCRRQLVENGTIRPFSLGEGDVPERLFVPQAIHGKGEERHALLSAFDRVTASGTDGRAALVLLTGSRGLGKSTLANALREPIARRRGYFIDGKFEKLEKAMPSGALVAALRSLVRQALGESEDALAALRAELAVALGSNAGIVLDLVPEASRIVGPEPPMQARCPKAAAQLWSLAFRSIIRVFANPSRPLVLFLDDLQWADEGSLEVLSSLLRDAEQQSLLVVGAYREPKVDPAHPLAKTIDALAAEGVSIEHIPLGLSDVNRLFNEASRALARELALLESDRTIPASTKERLEALRALSSELATSLEDAQPCHELEQQLAERNEELRKKDIELQEALERLRTTQTQLVQSEKMASLGRLTAGIAHEIKNPLNFVNNFAQLNVDLVAEIEEALASEPNTTLSDVADVLGDIRTGAAKIVEHGKRADGIVRSMMQHASGASGVRHEVDLNALVEDYVKLSYHGSRAEAQPFELRIERDYDDTVGTVSVVSQDLGRVLVNLFSNALYSVGEKKRKAIPGYVPALHVSTRREGKSVKITIRDNGMGIAEDVHGRIFEPFFTTKPGNAGTGLGLSMSHDIVVKRHGGNIGFESVEGDHATFVLTLPG